MSISKRLTTTAGASIADNQNALTAGPRGPLLIQDYQLLEKLAHQNRERIAERPVHAKGWGAYGTFTVTHDITRYTKAKIFSKIGKQTEMFARFSNVAGEAGAADAERDVRGFALKFYTEEGNWDLVGSRGRAGRLLALQHRSGHRLLAGQDVAGARVFSYADAHRHRLGTHYEAIPVNAPRCPVNHYHKDGQMRFFPNNPNPDAFYEPNSFQGPVESPEFTEPPLKISGDGARYDHREDNDDYGQPRALFNLFDPNQKARLFSNIAEAMQGVPEFIIERQFCG